MITARDPSIFYPALRGIPATWASELAHTNPLALAFPLAHIAQSPRPDLREDDEAPMRHSVPAEEITRAGLSCERKDLATHMGFMYI